MDAPRAARVLVPGLAVDPLTLDEAAGRIEAALAGRVQGGVVLTAGSLLAVAAARDPGIAQLVSRAWLVTADGAGIVWAARRLGRPLPERVTGVELADRVLARAARGRWPVAFVGGGPGTAGRAAAAMARRHPRLRIAVMHHGYFAEESEDERGLLDALRRSRVRLVLAGLGQPRQERWLERILPLVRARVGIGIGGVFDVWAGDVRLAPAWVGRLGLEWLWRLARQPWRAWRMRHLPIFVWLTLRAGSTTRAPREIEASSPTRKQSRRRGG